MPFIEIPDDIYHGINHADEDAFAALVEMARRGEFAPGRYRDALTGCLSSHHFTDDLWSDFGVGRRYDERRSPYVNRFLCLDIDNLKAFHDCFGHGAADAAIAHVGQLLRAAYPDRRIYRYGGDEFVVELGDEPVQHLAAVGYDHRRAAFGAVDHVHLDRTQQDALPAVVPLLLKYTVLDFCVKVDFDRHHHLLRGIRAQLERAMFEARPEGHRIRFDYALDP